MGKRKQTLARPPQRMTKKERSRWQRERRIQRNLIIVFIAIGVISVLVLGYGLYDDLIATPNRVIARVNGEAIILRDYWTARRMQLVSQWQQLYNNLQLYQSMGITMTEEQKTEFTKNVRDVLLGLGQVRQEPLDDALVQNVVRNTVLAQGARDMGLNPTPEEVDTWWVPGPQPSATSSPFGTGTLTETQPTTQTQATPTPVNTLSPQDRDKQIVEQLGNAYAALSEDMKNAAAGDLGFSSADYVAMVRHDVRTSYLQEKVQKRLGEDLPKTEDQVHVGHILITERYSRMLQAQQALEQGTSFLQVVVQYSDDPATRDKAGDLGWLTQGEGLPSAEVEQAAFAITTTGGLSPVVEDKDGYHILQLVERNDATGQVHVRHILVAADRRPVADSVLALVQSGNMSFEQVATGRSEDRSTASQGGDMGWLVQGEGKPSLQVEQAAFALTTTNPLSGIVEDQDGYHILQLVERDSAGGRVHVRQILIRTGPGLAQDIRDILGSRIKDFSEAVVAYSTDQATVALVGDMGWLTQGDRSPAPEVLAAALALTQTDQLSDIIVSSDGWRILQLVERDEANKRVHVRQVLVKQAKLLAEDIRAYILADAEKRSARFLEMALKYSDDQESRSNGGDLGWFGKGNAATLEIEETVFSLQPDQISDVFESKSGFHIVWLREHDTQHPLDQATLDSRAQQAFTDWLDKLVEQATVERFPPPSPTPTLPQPTEALQPTAVITETTVPVTETTVPVTRTEAP